MKRLKMKSILLSLSVSLLASGCASVMTAEQQTINITASNNEKIEVTIDDKTVMAPGMVTVLRDGKDKVVKTTDSNCDSATPIKKKVTSAFWGNIVIGGVLGSTTDSSTGKMWDYADSVQINCSNK